MILPSLILQKPSASSKSKEHVATIERRLSLWKNGDLSILMKEIRFIQSRFSKSKKARSVEDISKVFAKLVMQGKLTAAIKMLDKESSSGLLTLTPDVLEELTKKHPPAAGVENECLLHGPIDFIPPSIFDSIDEQLIYNSAMRTRGSAGPSGMDAQLYCRILCSKSFINEGKHLREEIAIMTRNLLRLSYSPSLLEGYTSCRLIPLDKNPGIRPIGVGEVLRRIIGKAISAFFKDDIREAAGPLQVCAGYTAGAEAAIHAMSDIFSEEETDGVLLVDANNAFNMMNRNVAMHNIQITCQEISLYIINTYRSPSRLFITGGGEILSQEGTTQGDPLAMPWYAINTSLMISNLRSSFPTVKQVWFADDSTGAGNLDTLSAWYKHLSKEGIKYGYHVNGSKSWLILKNHELSSAAERAFGDGVNISTEGKRHLGAVIGSLSYKEQFCTEKVAKWKEELEALSEIAKSQPQAAFVAFTKGFKSKFTFCMRTIESFEDFVNPIQEVLHEVFLPTLFGQEEPLTDSLHEVVTLTPNQGGLGIPCLKEDSPQQFAASKLITSRHTESIKDQNLTPLEDSEDLKSQYRSLKAIMTKSKIERIDGMMNPEMATYIDQARDKGASSWLNTIPYDNQGLTLNKQEFRDALRLRYNMPLSDLPLTCPCGSSFDVNHALSCKKGGFIAQRHDNVRDFLTTLLSKVCHNVQAEPRLIPLNGERFNLKSTTTSEDARLDIKAGAFWQRGVTAFFDVRVSHVNSKCNQKKTTSSIFNEQEQEKKRKYQQRVLEVEMGSFTPLIFGTNGGMGKESQIFLKTLADKLANKTGQSYSDTITYIRTKLSFEILKAVITCIRGSRTPFYKNNESDFLLDFSINTNLADIR